MNVTLGIGALPAACPAACVGAGDGNSQATRAQAATILMQFVKNIPQYLPI